MAQNMYMPILFLLLQLLPIPVSKPLAVERSIIQSSNQNRHHPEVEVCMPRLDSSEPILIPLLVVRNLLLMECRIDSFSGYLILDSGSTEIILNQIYFRDYTARTGGENSGITGSVSGVELITAEHLSIAGLEFRNVITHRADLGQLETKLNHRILGIASLDFFDQFILIIDSRNGQLQLLPLKTKNKQNKGMSAHFTPDCQMEIEYSENILFLQGSIGQKKLRFCLDTGAETNVINSNCPTAVISTIHLTGRSTVRGAGQRTQEVLKGTMNELTICDNQLANMKAILANLDPLNEVYWYHIDGMLGYPFLQQCCLCINFAEQTMGIKFYKETYIEMNR